MLLFVISVIYGYRKGFLNGFISICSGLFSFFVANFFGRFFLRSSIFGILNSFLGFRSNPGEMLNLGGDFFENSGPTVGLTNGLNGFGGPFLNYFVLWALMGILFVCSRRFFKKLFVLSSFLKKMPIISGIDGFLGAIFGALEATIFLFALAGGCYFLIFLTHDDLNFLNSKIIESTNLFSIFYQILPFVKF